jgi:hypothetical protein
MYKKCISYPDLTPAPSVIRISDGACIPFDDGNTDYQAYLKWIGEGNEPLQADLPPAPPEPTIEEKLASVGLSIDDLKTALGIK